MTEERKAFWEFVRSEEGKWLLLGTKAPLPKSFARTCRKGPENWTTPSEIDYSYLEYEPLKDL